MTKKEGGQSMKFKIGDKILFVMFSDSVFDGEIVAIKGKWLKKYRIIYRYGFLTKCEWIKERNLLRVTKEC